jgi:two-component system cell cycle response regulator DivK
MFGCASKVRSFRNLHIACAVMGKLHSAGTQVEAAKGGSPVSREWRRMIDGEFVKNQVETPPPDAASQGPAILIVDDSKATARGLGGLFRTGGYRPTTFHEGLAAIAWAREHRPSGAIIDVHLPDISGLILSQQLRELLGPTAPIVVLSGDASMEVLNALPHVGATYFFQKPVNGSMLLKHFHGLLGATFRLPEVEET